MNSVKIKSAVKNKIKEKIFGSIIKEHKRGIKAVTKELNTLNDKITNVEGKNRLLEAKLVKYELTELNKELSKGKYKNIVLTTYPEFTTGNVGDAMITDSFVKLIKVHNESFNYLRVFRGQSLDELNLSCISNIFAPGFSVAPGTYPKNYKLFSNLEKLKSFKFIPFGCSYQHYLPRDDSFSLENYSDNDINILKTITNNSGPLPCRDEMINEMMTSAGIDSFYSGDLVLFDPDVVGTEYHGCKEVKSVAVSVQHKAKYLKQSISLLKKLRDTFSDDVKIYLTFHGAENTITKKLNDVAKTLGIEAVSLYGESDNLHFYDNVDLHVGYRLHGHITFLRKRKPSILLTEDARAYGFSRTEGTAFGCFNAMNENKVSEDVDKEVIKFLKMQIDEDFVSYNKIFNFIDMKYENVIYPYFKKLTKDIVL